MTAFEWGADNESKLAAHGVLPTEAEDVFEDPRVLSRTAYQRDGEQREGIVGRTRGGRIVTVIYTRRGERIRVVTAYPTTGRLRRRYLETL